MVDLVSISFVKSFGLKACSKSKHQHVVPTLEGIGETRPQTYGFYHLRLSLTDRFNRVFNVVRPFLAVDRNPRDSQVLLGRPALKDFKINICNGKDIWDFEFERHPKVTMVSSHRFAKDLTPRTQVLELKVVFRPCEKEDAEASKTDDNGLSSIPRRLRTRYKDFFDIEKAERQPLHRHTDHAIELKPGTEPPYMRTYNMSPAELKALDEYLTKALAKGWIRESQSPAGAPVLFTPKKSGELRFCVDYRGLNAITIKNRYPLPLINELLDRLDGSVVFSKIDLRNAYHRIRIREGDEWKTAFRTRYGHFEYLVVPFGLTNAPATFQAYINRALRGLVDDFCIVYLDDILIFSKTEEAHLQHLELVIERLQRADLYANPKKCDFFKPQVEYLGFIIDKTGIRMDPERVKTISEWPRPQSYRDIQVFLGFCNFYRRFIYNFSGIAKPLQDLLRGLKKGKKPGLITDDWQDPQQKAFERLIDAFISAPVLRHYSPFLPLRLETDASSTACAGILSLKWEDGWHPIAYCSKKFSGAEVHYPIYDKELLAIVWSFKQWRHYLEGASDIEVWSDHENLKRFMTQNTLNGRQARWLIQLAPHDFTIRYRKGKLNPADGPSRRPDYMDEVEGPETAIAKLMPTLQNKLARAASLNVSTPNLDTGSVQSATLGADAQQIFQHACHSARVDDDDTEDFLHYSDVSSVDAQRRPGINSPEAESLIRTLALQVVTRSRAKQAAKCLLETESLPAVTEEAEDPEGATLGTIRGDTAPEQSFEGSVSLLNMIKNAQELDPQCRRIKSRLHVRTQQSPSLALVPGSLPQFYSVDEGGLLRYVDRVLIPAQEALRHQLLEVYHDCPSGGHWGRDKTLELIRRRFTWSGIAEDVREYVATCPVCQGKAIHRHRPYGELEPLPVPPDLTPFKEISLDWITGLPTSMRNGMEYNSILTIVCRVSKYALFIPTREDATAVDLAQLFFEHVECRFGTPRGIVTDRDSRITSEFWREICEIQMIKRRMSTAYHPQTDGQSEALNRIVEDYLRAYSTEEPNAWARLLPLAQFAYNNSRNYTTGMSPNRLLFGFDCEIRIDVADTVTERRIPAAKDRIEKLYQLRQRLRTRLIEAQERMARYYNANHVPKHFKVGDFVKLSTKNLKFKNRKLSPRWVGPFRVLERMGGQAYRLALPAKYSRLHDVFPVQLIESYRRRDDDNSLMAMPDLEDEQDDWEVEEVLDRRRIKDTVHYLVKWATWPSEYNSYEPISHLEKAPEAVAAFERKLKAKRKRKRTKTGESDDSADDEEISRRTRRRR